jgi:very-short-patch-repair endonuclease
MSRDLAPSPLAGEGWGEGSRDATGLGAFETHTGEGGATPHPTAAQPPSPARGEGKTRSPVREVLRERARAMRHEPTDAERKLWLLLRDRRFSGFKFRRQVQVGRYIADFVCPAKRLIVEVDGGHHAESTYDLERDAWLTAEGFRVRRFWNADILMRPDEVRDTLWHDLEGATIQDDDISEMKP